MPCVDPKDDASHLGRPDKLLFWTPEQQVAGYRNMDKVFPTRIIKAGGKPSAMPEHRVDLDDVQISYEDGRLTTDDYFGRRNVAGLLVIKNGHIVYERYGLGNSRDTKWVSFSVAKSVTSLLVGAAIRDGHIKSVDGMVTDYLPRMKGSSYDQASIRNILQMASGVAWNEDYADPDSDISRMVGIGTLAQEEYLRGRPVDAPPGEVFNYNTAETGMVGDLLRAAIGNKLSTYLSEKIWRPFGMEADANWKVVRLAALASAPRCVITAGLACLRLQTAGLPMARRCWQTNGWRNQQPRRRAIPGTDTCGGLEKAGLSGRPASSARVSTSTRGKESSLPCTVRGRLPAMIRNERYRMRCTPP